MLTDRGLIEVYKDFESEIEDIYVHKALQGHDHEMDIQSDYFQDSEYYIDILEEFNNLNKYFRV